jgi:hypothetical protein
VKYLLLICVDPSLEPDETPGEIEAWLDRLGDSRLIGNELRGAASAATVRVRRSERLVTDGPFAETKEVIAGFDVIDCETLEEAIEIAGTHPVAKFGAVEVREFVLVGLVL